MSYHPSPSKPGWDLPPAACDSHCHIFGPADKFPYAAERTYTPDSDAPREALFALHERLGIERCIIVQAGCHGFDNTVVADAIKAKQGDYLGIALAPADASAGVLNQLAQEGFRGVRFNFMQHLGKGASLRDVLAMTPRLARAGLHLQVHMESALIADMAPLLSQSPVPVVIDHMGRIDATLGIDQPAFIALLKLMEHEQLWVKLSGTDRCSGGDAPYADAVPFAAKLLAECGDRVLWGTDWPHPNISGAIPDDGQLVDLVKEIAPSAKQRQALMVDNPERLYGFDAAAQRITKESIS